MHELTLNSSFSFFFGGAWVQENDGFNISTLLDGAKDVLEDLHAMKDDTETAEDAIDFDTRALNELQERSQVSKTELSCTIIDRPLSSLCGRAD